MQIKITSRSVKDYEKTIARLKREGCKLKCDTEEASYWKACLCTYLIVKGWKSSAEGQRN